MISKFYFDLIIPAKSSARSLQIMNRSPSFIVALVWAEDAQKQFS